MEGSQRNELLSSFRKFLDKFCSEIDTSATDEDDLPIKLIWDYVLTSEIEGECLYWVLQYLSLYECPPLLALHIARATYVKISKLDMQQFYMDDDDEDDDDDDDTDDVDDSDDIKTPDNKDIGSSPNSEPVIPHIDSRRLMKEVIAVAEDICKQWKHSLPALLLPQRSLQVCSYAIKNTRRKMEDKHVILPDLNALFNLKDCPSQSYYAVFDGHGGVEAALYTASHLHCNFIRDNKFSTDVPTAIKNSYKLTDEWFLERAKRYKLRSGTTCVTLLIQESRLHISWLGDSQAVLVRNGEAVNIMNPHKPERPDEKERIEKLGGCVLHYGTWRVNGNIAVSRAIGDVGQKPFISSDAEVYSFDLDGKEDYVVLACDGAWDVLSFEDLPELVYSHIEENNGDKSMVAQKIVHYARDNGSNDNISVVVIFLRDKIASPHKKGTSFDFMRENGAEGGRFDREGKKRHNSDADKPSPRSKTNGGGKMDSSSGHSNKENTETVSSKNMRSSTQEPNQIKGRAHLHLEQNSSGSLNEEKDNISSHNWFRKCFQALLTFKKLSSRVVFPHSPNKRDRCRSVMSAEVESC